MEETILEAIERTKQPGNFKESGFVAGVVYGDGVKETTSVKFEETALKKILAKHGSNAKIWIKLNNEKKFGFIKEVKKHPLSGIVTHIDVQIVSKEHELKIQIPLVFKGEEELKQRQLQLQVLKPEVSVFGKMDMMVDAIYVDVSEKNLGDKIIFDSFNLDKKLKVNVEDAVYGIIVSLKVQPDEEVAVETITK